VKLLALTTSFPHDAEDYRGRFVAEWASSLVQQGDEVRVLAPSGGYSPDGVSRLQYYSPGTLLGGEGAPELLAKRPVYGALSGCITSAGMLWRATTAIRADEMLVGHWLIPSAFVALGAGRRWCTPVHGYAHGSDVALLERPGGRGLARMIDRKIMGITFVSDDLRHRYLRCLGRPSEARLSVIPMGITRLEPCGRFRRWVSDMAQGRRVVTTIGRLVPIKGLDVLVRALSGVEDCVWFAAGEGAERESLRRLAKQVGVHLITPGVISPDQREALLAETDVFVHPSRQVGMRREGTPVSVMEALSAGVPSVVSRTGGLSELAHDSGMLTVEAEDVGGLAEKLHLILDDEGRREEMKRRHLVVGERSTWSHVGALHREALQESARRFSCELP
jgi:glycosyltransferase involved in cell wall biosynthesis